MQSWIFATASPSQASVGKSDGQGLCTAATIWGGRAQLPSQFNSSSKGKGRKCPLTVWSDLA